MPENTQQRQISSPERVWPDSFPGPASEALAAERQAGRGLVLVVDDDPDVREILRKTLATAGYKVMQASDGQSALDQIVAASPEVIILDEMMPGMSGTELLHELQERGFLDEEGAVVIVLTARDEAVVDKARYLELGVAAVLHKPFGHREIRIIVDNLLTIRRMSQEVGRLHAWARSSERRYRALIESATDWVFTLDTAGLLVFVNASFERITGFGREEWIGRPLADLMIAPDRGTCRQAVRRCLRGEAQLFEARLGRVDGRVAYLSFHLSPLREGEEVIGVVGVARDTTDRRRLEDQVRELSDFTQTILHSLGSGLLTLDEERRITFANEMAGEILGWPSAELLGRSIDDVFASLGQQMVPGDLLRHGGSLASREVTYVRPDGKRIYIGYTITCRRQEGDRRVAGVLTFRDITDVKEMQAQVLRMDRLASLGVLASGIAHEIRNPLAGIKMMAQSLEEEIPPDDPKREHLRRIIGQVNRLDELIRQFFSYARPRKPVRHPHRLPEIIAEVRALLDKRLRTRGVEFREEYADPLPDVYVDFHQMQQVFMNLFLNALDAMPEGGLLIVRAEAVHTALHAVERRGRTRLRPVRGLFVRVEVEDTGKGIPEEILGSIFDPFFTTKSQGTGLGLSIVHRIMEEHGGEISVTSEVGKGTRFVLLIPTQELES
ncbi:MAG: PAS domain S-box protein [candidate division KSB1 bacterium]|nr:PAS domain S-box protein [candidate division KSB1 bacterium]